MRSAGNFNPEWGYLAPAPNFVRLVRIVVVAAAIGATAGAAVVFSLIDRPGAEESVAARTLAGESPGVDIAVAAAVPAHGSAQAHESAPAQLAPAPKSQVGHVLAADSAKVATMVRPANAAALAESPAVTDAAGAKSVRGFEKLAKEPQPAGHNAAQFKRTADRGPIALLRALGLPNAGPRRGDY